MHRASPNYCAKYFTIEKWKTFAVCTTTAVAAVSQIVKRWLLCVPIAKLTTQKPETFPMLGFVVIVVASTRRPLQLKAANGVVMGSVFELDFAEHRPRSV